MGVQIRRLTADHLLVELGPSFRAEDARRVHDLLDRSDAGTSIDLDFHGVTDCHAVALGLLAGDLMTVRAHVALHGVPWHEERLLGYLGVPVDTHASHA
jgi:hypothetical protein